jgi:hypothetical protein
VACPFFMPIRRMESTVWKPAARLPLGELYAGVCHAQAELAEPPEPVLRDLCNCGYARGRCSRLPPGDHADAVRFSLLSDDAGAIRLICVLEKDHAPAEHQYLECGLDGVVSASVSETLRAQARAFIESYVRLRNASAGARTLTAAQS